MPVPSTTILPSDVSAVATSAPEAAGAAGSEDAIALGAADDGFPPYVEPELSDDEHAASVPASARPVRVMPMMRRMVELPRVRVRCPDPVPGGSHSPRREGGVIGSSRAVQLRLNLRRPDLVVGAGDPTA